MAVFFQDLESLFTKIGKGDETGYRISDVAPGQVCRCNLYKVLNCLTGWLYITNHIDMLLVI